MLPAFSHPCAHFERPGAPIRRPSSDRSMNSSFTPLVYIIPYTSVRESQSWIDNSKSDRIVNRYNEGRAGPAVVRKPYNRT
ncbi:hypothetical protein CPB85DRAFT_99778 [Mucidula mucida]|nr:hypothetical protein CPB85DRAFT_99778 [Mucidula mucida]